MNHLFCFGFGYCARALAETLIKQNWRITGTTRQTESATENNIQKIQFNGTEPIADFESLMRDVTHLLISIPPDDDGDVVLRHHAQHIKNAASTLKWIGYLSTTGVYGHRNGDWVDETSPLMPTTQRGQRRVLAEKQWLDTADDLIGFPIHIFRLAGIYGPGRNAFLTLQGKKPYSIVKKGQVFSRIHQWDIRSILFASINRPNPCNIYNLCDDEAAPPQDVLAYAALISGLPAPEPIAFEEALNKGMMSPMARSFYAESKRVDNQKIKQELRILLRYPTYRHGLDALWRDMQQEGRI